MLDTNICIEIIRYRTHRILEHLQLTAVGDVCISSITLGELEYGVHKSKHPERNRLALVEFITPIEIIPFDEMAAVCYGQIRTHLEGRGLPIGPLDTLIAAHALAIDTTLVTNNTAEFRRVPGLSTTDWSR